MLFGKYHIVIFREGKSGSRNLNVSGWFCFIATIFALALISCNIWLWRDYVRDGNLGASLENAERVIADQKRQTINLGEKIAALNQDMERVRKFNSTLRLMMNLEKGPAEVGEYSGNFSTTYLPLHRRELAARKMRDYMDELGRPARLEPVNKQDLLRSSVENQRILASPPSMWPVNGFVASSFGSRIPAAGGGEQIHRGIDIENRQGAPVIAPADGTVIMAAPDGAYGNSVEINHGGGIATRYAHLRSFEVRPGQSVKRGDVLGYVGMSGRAAEPRLHYETRINGVPVNPMRYLLE